MFSAIARNFRVISVYIGENMQFERVFLAGAAQWLVHAPW